MNFSSDKQRKFVMSKYNNFSTEVAEIKKKSVEPLFPLSSPFSKKGDRGSVPLLDTTFVIRGGLPAERKKTKEVLDMIGEDPSMESINQIRILRDAEAPITFEGEKTIIVNEEFLKGGVFDVGVMMLATAYRIAHPEVEEGREYAYATEVVEPKIKEQIRIDRAEKAKRETEVYQVGVDRQPEYDVIEYDGSEPYGPIEAKVTSVEDVHDVGVDDRSMMLGVSGLERDNYEKTMEEQMKKNMYIGN